MLSNRVGTRGEWSESCSVVSTLCDPMDCSLPGSSVHGILQARILEWVAIPFSRGSSQPRDQTWVSYIAGRFFTIWATKEPKLFGSFKSQGYTKNENAVSKEIKPVRGK